MCTRFQLRLLPAHVVLNTINTVVDNLKYINYIIYLYFLVYVLTAYFDNFRISLAMSTRAAIESTSLFKYFSAIMCTNMLIQNYQLLAMICIFFSSNYTSNENF